jgi:hypothetical protein
VIILSRSDHTLPTELYELDLFDRFGFTPEYYEWGPLVYHRPIGRILNTRTRRANSYKHRERRRWNHAERRRVKNDLANGQDPAPTRTRNQVRWDMW